MLRNEKQKKETAEKKRWGNICVLKLEGISEAKTKADSDLRSFHIKREICYRALLFNFNRSDVPYFREEQFPFDSQNIRTRPCYLARKK